mmetsp:Transcript_61401/g.144484  ORF Transcript_61401/g.144484 Transcript_61401/m.144484 type:complete len:358 (+) Transcript_61401:317-1390(+)
MLASVFPESGQRRGGDIFRAPGCKAGIEIRRKNAPKASEIRGRDERKETGGNRGKKARRKREDQGDGLRQNRDWLLPGALVVPEDVPSAVARVDVVVDAVRERDELRPHGVPRTQLRVVRNELREQAYCLCRGPARGAFPHHPAVDGDQVSRKVVLWRPEDASVLLRRGQQHLAQHPLLVLHHLPYRLRRHAPVVQLPAPRPYRRRLLARRRLSGPMPAPEQDRLHVHGVGHLLCCLPLRHPGVPVLHAGARRAPSAGRHQGRQGPGVSHGHAVPQTGERGREAGARGSAGRDQGRQQQEGARALQVEDEDVLQTAGLRQVGRDYGRQARTLLLQGEGPRGHRRDRAGVDHDPLRRR